MDGDLKIKEKACIDITLHRRETSHVDGWTNTYLTITLGQYFLNGTSLIRFTHRNNVIGHNK